MTYKTASVEILDGNHMYPCDINHTHFVKATYNVFDGTYPVYACGKHLAAAVQRVATRK